MKNLKREALQFAERLQTPDFVQRNASARLPAMPVNTAWIGTGAQVLCLTLERHEIIMDQTPNIIFAWAIPKDALIANILSTFLRKLRLKEGTRQ